MMALLKGDNHPAVGTLQKALNLAGTFPALDIDNDFGDYTQAAVQRFQDRQPQLDCMYAGTVGPRTLDALGIRLEVESLVFKWPLVHRPSENWAAGLGVQRIMYSQMGPRYSDRMTCGNSDPGDAPEIIAYTGTGFLVAGYDALVGGRITTLKNGAFVFHGQDDPDREFIKTNECALLVQAFGLPQTRYWRRGPRVVDVPNLLPGTVVATMHDDTYYNDYLDHSHVAIFLGKDLFGMRTLDQWNGSDIHREYREFMPEEVGESCWAGKASWVSNAAEYYVLYSDAPSVYRDRG